MSKVLIVYHSREGQAAKIASRITEVIRARGAEVVLADAADDPDPAGFDGVILGDSIHLGRHSRALRRWIAHHEDRLDWVPTALFQVSLTSSHDDDEHVAEAHAMVQRLLDATDLDPAVVGLFAGALKYTQYGWVKRSLMRRIAAAEGGDADTSTDHEYTDWDAVEHFAIDALDAVDHAA